MKTKVFLDAVKEGDIATVSALLKKEPALIKARSDFGELTCLHFSVRLNRDGVLTKILIEAGADVNAQSIIKSTPLMSALHLDADIKVISMLLDAGADLFMRDWSGQSALDIARRKKECGLELPPILLEILEKMD